MSKTYTVKCVLPDGRKHEFRGFKNKAWAEEQRKACLECGCLRATVKKEKK